MSMPNSYCPMTNSRTTASREITESSGTDSDSDTTSTVIRSHERLGAETKDMHSFIHIPISQSVYESAFLTILLDGHRNSGIAPKLWISNGFPLLLTLVLQIAVLIKVQYVQMGRLAVGDLLWESCRPVPELLTNTTYLPMLASHPDRYHCGTVSIDVLYDTQRLDINNDGYWSRAEARTVAEEWALSGGTDVQVDMVSIFDTLYPGIGMQKVPLEWVRAKSNILVLCRVADAKLCGNLEARNILKSKFVNISEPHDRIASCERLIAHDCPTVFAEEFKLGLSRRETLCGAPLVLWSKKRRIRLTVYVRSERYNNDAIGIETVGYMMFQFAVLTIWISFVFAELRDIIAWWQLVIFAPKGGDLQYAITKDDMNHAKIVQVPWLLWFYNLIFILLPRSCVCVYLFWEGAKFLVHTDTYMDLILNSVALGFLIEIDNYLFAATASRRAKNLVLQFEGVMRARWTTFLGIDKIMGRGGKFADKYVPRAMVYAMIVTCCAAFMCSHAYFRQRGKLDAAAALDCFCMASGVRCSAPLILGGLDKEFYDEAEIANFLA